MAALHPQVVHFTIALVILGVAFRLVSLLGRPAFAAPAATTLLLLAAAAGIASDRSGDAAHGPVERAPGARAAVQVHERWGERTEQVLMGVALLELIGLALRRSPKVKVVRWLSAAAGLVAVACVYEAGEHGGQLVYAYAGGVGIRSGDQKDVERLLLAGFYQQAMVERAAGRPDKAAALIAAAAAQFPSDADVRLLAIESMLLDNKNPQGAIDALATVQTPADNRFMVFRVANLKADALEAVGQKDAAIATLEAVLKTFPNPRLQQRIDKLKSGAGR